MTTPLELVVLDMAGTTVLDDGVVEQVAVRYARLIALWQANTAAEVQDQHSTTFT